MSCLGSMDWMNKLQFGLTFLMMLENFSSISLILSFVEMLLDPAISTICSWCLTTLVSKCSIVLPGFTTATVFSIFSAKYLACESPSIMVFSHLVGIVDLGFLLLGVLVFMARLFLLLSGAVWVVVGVPFFICRFSESSVCKLLFWI